MLKDRQKENLKIGSGLQKVDSLSNSQYFVDMSQKYFAGEITRQDMQKQVFEYYEFRKQYPKSEKMADIVSINIQNILESDGFSLCVETLNNIHKQLFNKIYLDCGVFRTKDLIKKEWVLNGDTVIYSSYTDILSTLKYDFNEEKNFDYSNLNMNQKIEHIASFISDIWQIHPFAEGNTRTIAIFLIKYLRYLGFETDNSIFKQNSWYFRNALVRANYRKAKEDIVENKGYLIKFLSNMILNTNYPLNNRYLHIYADINKSNLSINEKTIINEISANPQIKSDVLANKLNVSIRTLRSLISDLKQKKIIKRVNGNKKGFWDITINKQKG